MSNISDPAIPPRKRPPAPATESPEPAIPWKSVFAALEKAKKHPAPVGGGAYVRLPDGSLREDK